MDRTMILYLLALALYLSTWKCAAAHDYDQHRISFPVHGNVYPDAHVQYNVTILIGHPAKPYTLRVDTGSNLTWVQCAPCAPCYPGHHNMTLYKKLPKPDLVRSNDPICQSLHHGSRGSVYHPCDYKLYHTNGGPSTGVLVTDKFNITLKNGTTITPRLAFGCNTYQIYSRHHHVPLVDGVLGLGKGGSGFLAQLSNMNVTKSVVCHCFSSKGGGYLSIGDPGLILFEWKPIVLNESRDGYFLGLADVEINGRTTDINNLRIVFDSGSTYTSLPSPKYKALRDLIVNSTNLTVTADDKTLPICWKGVNTSASVGDIAPHFKTLALNFKNNEDKIIKFELRPESYLIVSKKGNPCLGILKFGEFARDTTVIGAISMQDTLVMYDNVYNQVGWVPANCSGKLP